MEQSPKPHWYFAELNIAKCLYPLDDQRMEGFVSQLAHVNAMAEAHEGFIWRYVESETHPAHEAGFAPEVVINLSIWRDLGALQSFMRTEPHRQLLKNRAQWFAPLEVPHLALWWTKSRCLSLSEAKAKWSTLHLQGPSPEVFSWTSIPPVPQD